MSHSEVQALSYPIVLCETYFTDVDLKGKKANFVFLLVINFASELEATVNKENTWFPSE